MILKIIFILFSTVSVCLGQTLFDIRVDTLPTECDHSLIPTSCEEATACTNRSGFYIIRNSEFSTAPFMVLCDAVTDAGGWTVVQSRRNDSVDFSRTWSEYETGFGTVDSSFFIGFKKLLAFLKQMGSLELYIELQHGNDATTNFAKYDNFVIGEATEEYMLKNLGEYLGNTQDGLGGSLNYAFLTKDSKYGNCAESLGGGWWYPICYCSNLNAKYDEIRWGSLENITFVKMMVRQRRRQSTNDCEAKASVKSCDPYELPENCETALACTVTSGINIIEQAGFEPYAVECIADIDEGDWLVVLSRHENSFQEISNYGRTEFIDGFGSVTSENYFIGLNKLYNFGMQELLIQLIDYEGRIVYAKYDKFSIGNASEEYAIVSLGKYSGTAGNALAEHMFLPFVMDDGSHPGLCQVGWWCSTGTEWSNLSNYLLWLPFPFNIVKAKMMIRPSRCHDENQQGN